MARDIGDVYGDPTVRVYPNAIVKSFHPILTPEERERRMMDIARAAASLIASASGQAPCRGLQDVFQNREG